jgi:hypothetical protein
MQLYNQTALPRTLALAGLTVDTMANGRWDKHTAAMLPAVVVVRPCRHHSVSHPPLLPPASAS